MEEKPRCFAPPASSRAFWDTLPINRVEKITKAEKMLSTPIPDLPDELYLDYRKTSRREPFQKPFDERLKRAGVLALAETLEMKGRFLEPLRAIIQAILSEPSWVMPAHDEDLAVFYGKKIYVDLGSSMRAATLATIINWLGESLGPEIVNRVKSEIRRRVVDPYLEGAYHDKKEASWDWVTGINNWNAVCHAGVVYATLATVEEKETRARVAAASANFIKNYLNGFTTDGYCSEGIGYWSYGFGHFVILAERLLEATTGRLDIYQDPIVAKAATFPARFQLTPEFYPAFSDNSISSHPQPWILTMLGRRHLLDSVPPQKLPPDQLPLGGELYEIDLMLNPPPVTGIPLAIEPSTSLRGVFDIAGVLVCRPIDQQHGLAVAMKGGHNNENHNHNDVGTYALASGGVPVLGDPGGEVYTKRTFSSHRYDSKVLSSYGHPVPVVDGQLQSTGSQAKAKILSLKFSDTSDHFVMDLTTAYLIEGLTELKRSFIYNRTGATSLVIQDEMTASRPLKFGTTLITYGEVHRQPDGSLQIIDGDHGVCVTIETNKAEWKFSEEVINENMLDNERKPRRIGIDLTDPTTSALIKVTITPLNASS
jgi:hypothetical protein